MSGKLANPEGHASVRSLFSIDDIINFDVALAEALRQFLIVLDRSLDMLNALFGARLRTITSARLILVVRVVIDVLDIKVAVERLKRFVLFPMLLSDTLLRPCRRRALSDPLVLKDPRRNDKQSS